MAEERNQRRLAAIVAADVVGYSRLIEQDEAATLAVLKQRRREILQPLVAEHHGRIVKVMGDGVLLEFGSAVNAVACTTELQKRMAMANEGVAEDRRISLRVGINLGDVVVDGGDIYGDGVNVAARLQEMAEPSGILMSKKVYEEIVRKLSLACDDLGEQSLKNIATPVRIYRVAATRERLPDSAGFSLPAKPSIAVLPFTNMSGDPEQDYFSDGITEDIITDLSQVSALYVAARNTSFTFKGKAVEVVRVARTLNVGHVLEGSVRRAGNRIRITAQLIDGTTGGHLWAQRYDRDMGDIFAVQDDVSKSVVAALKVRLLPEELKALTTRATASAEAYRYYLQARSSFVQRWGDSGAMKFAREMFIKALELDPGFARAYAGIADCDACLWATGDVEASFEDILANSNKALQLTPNLAEAHASRGLALYVAGRSEEAIEAFERSIQLDPELFQAHYFYGFSCRDTGRFEKAATLYERAAELMPAEYTSLSVLGDSYRALGLMDEAAAASRRSMLRIEAELRAHPDNAHAMAYGAATLIELGEAARAEEWARQALAKKPEDMSVRYNTGCTFAVMGKLTPALENLEYMAAHSPRARGWLFGIVKHDTQWNSIRNLPEFEAFMSRLKAETAADT